LMLTELALPKIHECCLMDEEGLIIFLYPVFAWVQWALYTIKTNKYPRARFQVMAANRWCSANCSYLCATH
jgi:hypothetical protein